MTIFILALIIMLLALACLANGSQRAAWKRQRRDLEATRNAAVYNQLGWQDGSRVVANRKR